MKRLFLLLAVVGISFTACTEVGEIDEIGTTEQPDNGNTDNPETPADPENPENPNNPETPADPENPENPEMQIIKFQDDNTKLICILHWDEDEDGELSYEEAAAVTNLGTAFKASRILAFTELEYFTGLKNIANGEFIDCASLVSISIPAQITSIGEDAFSGCTNLKKIYTSTLSGWCKIDFSNSTANPLYNGGKLYINGAIQTDITIPSDITKIQDYAFFGCSSLTNVTIPNSVTSIDAHAFSYCSSLTRVTIPNSVTSIGYGAFSYCTSLTSVTIPDSVTSIDNYAFEECTSLTSVTIGNGVTSIGAYAFTKCYSLTSVNISDLSAWCKISFNAPNNYGVGISINVSSNPLIYGAKLYINGVEQTDITIPSDIAKINDYTFNHCTSLTSVTIPDNVTSIGLSAFYDCTSLTSVTIPDSVTSIDDYAFGKCTSLRSVNISDLYAWCKLKFNKMESNPLIYGAKLYINSVEQTDITIPSDISKINAYAFYGCTSLESVIIPNSVTSIGEKAFCNCFSLHRLLCKATRPPKGGSYMFAYYKNDGYYYPKCIIYVPYNSVSAYVSASYWASYAESIKGYDF